MRPTDEPPPSADDKTDTLYLSDKERTEKEAVTRLARAALFFLLAAALLIFGFWGHP